MDRTLRYLLDVVVKEQPHTVEELVGRKGLDPARRDIDFEEEMVVTADLEVSLLIRSGQGSRTEWTRSSEWDRLVFVLRRVRRRLQQTEELDAAVGEAIALVLFRHELVEQALPVVGEVPRIVRGRRSEQLTEGHSGRTRFLELLIRECTEYLEPGLVREEIRADSIPDWDICVWLS
ncbi:hypothetical protein ACFQGE_17945 [Halomicroarcula sp. GCM10025817]|uniref:hypothetical protein n=1 Tax=Haloarcula TaxID=2237 RepID=UPI0023E846BB|nr:hypothetical protein [Halomicroarcula sp. SYNS111]